MADRLNPSTKADEILNALRFGTKLEKVVLSRIAFALSINRVGRNVPESNNFGGGEIKRPTFVGEDELFLRTIISFVYGTSEYSEEDFFSNRSIIKNHIDNGAEILNEMYKEVNLNSDLLLSKLSKEVDFSEKRLAFGKNLDLIIGKTIIGNQDVTIEINDTKKHANSHLAIMGKPGVGKTQLLLKILTDIRLQTNYQTNFIYFDYKGDVVDNLRFIELAKVQTFRLLQDGHNLPINPFLLASYDDQSINVSAREKAESFSSINKRLGVIQKGKLADAIRISYEKRKSQDEPYPDFQEVLDITMDLYKREDRKEDSLIEVLKDLANFDLFWKHGNKNPPINRISNRTFLVDLHAMPVLKELVVYLVIERLYKEMAFLPDSPIKDDRRVIRTILVIDEAHNYLNQNNLFLQRIIREGRSKGVVVFFASQSPSDYNQEFFNFQELLEFALIFQSEGVTASSVQKILGCSNKTARDLQVEIARLEPWQVIMRGQEHFDDFIKFKADAFYKSFR